MSAVDNITEETINQLISDYKEMLRRSKAYNMLLEEFHKTQNEIC